jgi:hypothetical protein
MTDKTKEFINKAREIHGDKYDYSKVEYENNLTEVIIICKEHGEFLQLPKTHKKGNGCKKCGLLRTINSKKSNTNDFIDKARQIHGDKYDYSKVEYKYANEQIIIICKEHGEFLQTPNGHLVGRGCRLCAIKINSNKLRKTQQQFIKEAIEIHGNKYDYSKVEYENNLTEVIIICKEHGEFLQTPSNHLNGKGCYLCGRFKINEKCKYTTQEFIEKAKHIHGDKFDYSQTIYTNCDENVIIICKEHGEFEQTPTTHLKSTFCCQKCVLLNKGKWNSISQEDFISKALIIHNDMYDYSKVKYKKAIEKVIIVCKIHGDFEITPNSHLNGSGCYHCGKLIMSSKQSLTTEEFINKSIKIHGNLYDYSKINYINNYTKILIICKEHGEFEQTPQGHLSGRKCAKCANKYSPTSNEWIVKAKEIHGDLYDYSKVNYINAYTPVVIICKKHGDFKQRPIIHLRPAGCKRCGNVKGYSKPAIDWLNFIQVKDNIIIQHAENDGEFLIPTTQFHADGYCKETNTIYEFHGDFWHGNPKKYDPSDVNSKNGKTFGELYQKTLEREYQIRDMGFNLITIWENDWVKFNKYVRILQKK